MEKVVKFIDCYIETETCNLKCHYCYIALRNKFKNRIIDNKRGLTPLKKYKLFKWGIG